jgi:hypothetical protein
MINVCDSCGFESSKNSAFEIRGVFTFCLKCCMTKEVKCENCKTNNAIRRCETLSCIANGPSCCRLCKDCECTSQTSTSSNEESSDDVPDLVEFPANVCKYCRSNKFTDADMCTDCQMDLDNMGVEKLEQFPRHIREVIDSSKHGNSNMRRTSVMYLGNNRNDNPDSLRELLTFCQKHRDYPDIDYSILTIYHIAFSERGSYIENISRSTPRSETKYHEKLRKDGAVILFRTENYPGTVYVITDYNIRYDCDSCDGTTTSDITLMALEASDKDGLIKYLVRVSEKEHIEKINLDLIFSRE